MSILENIGAKFQGNEGGARLYGLGLLASQLGSGQMPNAGPALQMLEDRKSQNALKAQMQGGEFMNQFTPEEQAFLATLPPAAAQQLIAQRVFAAPAAPTSGVEINGQLVDPITGRLMGDFRDPEGSQGVETRVVNGQLVNAETGEVIGDYRDEGGEISYIASGDAAVALGLPADGAYNVTSGPEGMKATAIGGGGQVININESEVGAIPAGYELFTDENGARQMRAIPGGPADTSTQDQLKQEGTERSGGIVTEDIGRALEIIEDAPGWSTGLGASLSSIPGTSAKKLDGLLSTIKANVGFDRLQQMRDSSPTGGALGAVNNQEMALLQSVIGNLEQSQDAETLAFNLNRVNEVYLDIIHGPGVRPDAGTPSDLSDEDLISKYGG